MTVLIDFINQRKMQLKMNNVKSSVLDLVGGGPQGSLLGQLLYIIGSDDVVEEVEEEDKFKYVDDLSVAEALQNRDNLSEYDFVQHVASDIAIHQKFLAPDTLKTQNTNKSISTWTEDNIMKLNETKSNYLIVSKLKEDFVTRLSLNDKLLDRKNMICHLGIWITEDLTWNKNTSEICKKAYSRMKMLTKLKYIGCSTEDLIKIYCLFIRSKAEYCSVTFHSTLTKKLSDKIETIQKTSLKVILNENYVSYEAVLEMCGLESLYCRRKARCLKFGLKSGIDYFPLNPTTDTHETRCKELFKVNKAKTESYRKSAIPYIQRRLNSYYQKKYKSEKSHRRK